MTECINDLMEFIELSPTAYQGAEETERRLENGGYKKLSAAETWHLKSGGKYYTVNGSSAVMAFEVGEKPWESGFAMVGSHLDSPSFRIKPNSAKVSEEVLTLNTEVYGGPIYHTWFDRPLSLAGRVIFRKNGVLAAVNTDLKKPVAVIPSLAIHIDRKINEGKKWNPQKDLLPVLSLNREDSLEEVLEREIGGKIVDCDLYLYPTEKPEVIGLNGELISSPRLDNLGMVHASLTALLNSGSSSRTKVFLATNHEEIGSRTTEGALSSFPGQVLERIVLASGGNREDFFKAAAKSFMISADQAHGIHPNAGDVADPTNRPVLGGGPVIKVSANRSYTSDGWSSAVFRELCREVEVPCQTYVNASDRRGGTTIGPLSTTQLNISGVDVGNPLWGMHSARETGAVADQEYMIKVLEMFYSK